MNLNRFLFTFFFCILLFPTKSQISIRSDSLLTVKRADSLLSISKKPFNAVGLITATNMGVWSFDRFIIGGPYARVNFNTIKQNFKTGFVWDNDMFVTNLFAHPYHGGLYFNAARTSGMNYWQSIPFSAGGSLMWEFCMENEPAAINDFMATSIGGTCLGEITFRISDLVIDDRSVGFERFKREALLTILSPIRGLNRLLNGDAWKHRNIKGNSISGPPVIYYATLGHRIIRDDSQNQKNLSNMLCFDLGLYYGNPFDKENEKPFDFFSLKLAGNFFSQQPVISRVNALGMIYAKDIFLRKEKRQLTFGIFQHFNFYQSQADINNVSLSPYKISEAASVGPGFLYKTKLTHHFVFSSSLHLSGILLGGSQTDHFRFEKRDYNMGSGFSSKFNLELNYRDKARLFLNSEDYRLYSWIGYNPADTETVNSNVQGDVGISSLSVVRLNFNYTIKKHFLIAVEASVNYRKSIYKYYPTIQHGTKENKISVGYVF